jgi:glycosyltransferase involved in cell wall biosynthesis
MRIVALNWRDLAHPDAGGAEIVIDRILSGLAARGHTVGLVCGGPVGTRSYEVADAGGTYGQYIRAPWIARRQFDRADVFIDSQNGMPFFTPLWTRTPSICMVHHVHTDQWGSRFPAPVAAGGRAVERHVFPAVYRHRLFVAVSRSTADALVDIGVPDVHIRVIESGVDRPESVSHYESDSALFVALTRLVPHKRVDLLLETWRRVQPVTGGRFVVIGNGPQLASLRQQAAGIPGVEVAGWLAEPAKEQLLSQAWLLVHAASHEGWGMGIMEAAAWGTPALVVDAPGVRDSVVTGVTGVTVAGDADQVPDALARAWISLAQDPARRRDLGAAARNRAAGYTWDRTVDSWSAVIDEAVSRRSRPLRDARRSSVGDASDLEAAVNEH